MSRYVLKRLFMVIPILLGVTFVVFSILNLTPGDPGRQILGMQAPQADVDQLNEELGFNKPFLARFISYIADIVTRFDFGKSYGSRRAVLSEIIIRVPNTFKIAFLECIFMSLIGVPLGILSAVKQYSLADNIAKVCAILLAAIPVFWLGMMFILVFSLNLNWLPSSGADSWRHFVLPITAMAVTGAAPLLRLTRSTMLETIRQDYIRTARAKGASERSIIWKHAFRNAMFPVITSIGVSFGAALGGTILIESVFAIPGLGTLTIDAIRRKDIPLVMGTTIFLAALFCLIILLVDIIYAYIDPRIKAAYSE